MVVAAWPLARAVTVAWLGTWELVCRGDQWIKEGEVKSQGPGPLHQIDVGEEGGGVRSCRCGGCKCVERRRK